MIDNRGHSVVVYDQEQIEIFSIGQPFKSRDAVIDLHSNRGYAHYTRDELREISEAIVMFTNYVNISSES